MASIVDSLTSLISSILNAILSAFQYVFAVFQNLLSAVIDLVQKFAGFILGNIVIIGILAAAVIGYGAYNRQQQQKQGIMGKKSN